MESSCLQLASRTTVCVRSHVTTSHLTLRRSSRLAFGPRAAARAQLTTGTRCREALLTVAHVGSVYESPRSQEKSGGGVMDRPVTSPNRDSEFDLSKKNKKKKPPQYRVLLHNDNFNKREYVVQVLLKIIPGMSVDIACNVMQEAHVNGKATVITAPQPDAEDYCEGLRANGLVASIEPASDDK
mmetsp:Transcript_1981/g.4015  ORF Transcript_1981/g.4015 Transcript_1981/m.4015 type:complete len:184 (+) Transcript_1981:134-685(+)|eukprot:CAMPEP_0118926534 /NCGR_PEP_ID=MMETSP1169-20130426/4196_1 /TAXON_ID=36882 /ORGANISM="Pyramimonas obovata, Strain CCMP722" /LENGTH=183 /DNA_ID=CAMNT_0006868101 /DNA_START=112 /DNA_END=663 /DNA_ORIENTATION=-